MRLGAVPDSTPCAGCGDDAKDSGVGNVGVGRRAARSAAWCLRSSSRCCGVAVGAGLAGAVTVRCGRADAAPVAGDVESAHRTVCVPAAESPDTPVSELPGSVSGAVRTRV